MPYSGASTAAAKPATCGRDARALSRSDGKFHITRSWLPMT